MDELTPVNHVIKTVTTVTFMYDVPQLKCLCKKETEESTLFPEFSPDGRPAVPGSHLGTGRGARRRASTPRGRQSEHWTLPPAPAGQLLHGETLLC